MSLLVDWKSLDMLTIHFAVNTNAFNTWQIATAIDNYYTMHISVFVCYIATIHVICKYLNCIICWCCMCVCVFKCPNYKWLINFKFIVKRLCNMYKQINFMALLFSYFRHPFPHFPLGILVVWLKCIEFQKHLTTTSC